MSPEGGAQAANPETPAKADHMEEDIPSQPSPGPLYRPLFSSEIRLIRLRPGRWDDPIACDLITVRLDDKPKFVALSYAWGDAADTQPITLNKQNYNITVNLFQGLRRLRDMVSQVDRSPKLFITDRLENFYLWADAICINQGDEQEKSYQIVRMREIYMSAYGVCAWLGENTKEEVNIRRLESMTQSLEVDESLWSPYFHDLFGRSRVDLENCAAGVFSLIARSWFSRVWVIQEVALAAQEPVLLAGGAWMNLNAFATFLNIISGYRSRLGNPIQELLNSARAFSLVEIRQAYAETRNNEEASDIDKSALGSRLDKVVGNTHGYFRATLPQDYIYGILGLVSSGKLPDILQPDYSKALGQVYQDYTRFMVETTGNLSVLCRESSSLEGFPSWVPDFSAECTAKWRKPSADVLGSLSFSRSGDKLILRGLEVGNCVYVYTPPCRDLADLFVNSLAWLQQLDIFLEKASSTTNSTKDETLDRWLELKHPWNPIEMRRFYQSIIHNKVQVNWNEQSMDFTFFGAALYTYSTLVTSSGILATLRRLDHLSQPDDILVVVKGNSNLILLRPNKGNDLYTFLGHCHSVGFEYHDELFSNNVLKEFAVA